VVIFQVRALRLAAIGLFCLLPVGHCGAGETALLEDIRTLATKAANIEVAFCNVRAFDSQDCEKLLTDLRSGQNAALVHPTVVAGTTSDLASQKEFASCDLTAEGNPFGYEDSDGIVAAPSGPFELFRQRATEGEVSASLLSVTGYSSVSDPGSEPYSWKSFYRVTPDDPCHPAILSFSKYGGSDRPAAEFHEDGVVDWGTRTLIVTVSEIGDGLFRIDAYATHKPADAATSQVAAFDLTVLK
jgi:hypothetical protein